VEEGSLPEGLVIEVFNKLYSYTEGGIEVRDEEEV
jgi:hypothetical protein